MKNLFSKDRQQPNLLGSIDQFFQQTLNHLPRPFTQRIIPVRVEESVKAYTIIADLPGIEKNAIHLRSHYQSLMITIEEKEQVATLDEKGHTLSEQQSVSIRERSVPVPFSFSEADIHAHYANGQLTITIKKNEKPISID
ncbi:MULTISPECIES: Hsp20/alpha crystallin family protein [Shouchella]|uniref:Hsp20/alpha crystallin family protein n=2 Tax=Shouchella TaxID=2893057 RepID=A0ABY7W825_9BACI|nr:MULTISPECIES: Hsp20/alpha crystallin family protein [Shouchella]MED4127176.1 Hsp20/alpha crystallin family protein [Shouchella miscanthi]WDF03658.1 Hsp20/alpha crystallin family protein [Shouchella hunanensis]GAF23535.1 heat shock protein class I [Bacillus sp. JCM 19047]